MPVHTIFTKNGNNDTEDENSLDGDDAGLEEEGDTNQSMNYKMGETDASLSFYNKIAITIVPASPSNPINL